VEQSAGPIGLSGVRLVADPEVMEVTNFVVGANENETHYVNANHGRDFKVTEVTTIRSADVDDICPRCQKGRLSSKKGIEVGNTFNLGYKYSKALNAKYIDHDGQEKMFYMGSYGIGVTRTIQAAAEKYNDDKGIIWPAPIAPYSVEILPLSMQDEDLRNAAFGLYDKLSTTGVEVIMDDRDERAGVKFNDADLVGIPLRVNVGSKSLKQGKLELKERASDRIDLVDVDNAVDVVKDVVAQQMQKAQQQ
jgi:prolyl-tRNA synthetase